MGKQSCHKANSLDIFNSYFHTTQTHCERMWEAAVAIAIIKVCWLQFTDALRTRCTQGRPQRDLEEAMKMHPLTHAVMSRNWLQFVQCHWAETIPFIFAQFIQISFSALAKRPNVCNLRNPGTTMEWLNGFAKIFIQKYAIPNARQSKHKRKITISRKLNYDCVDCIAFGPAGHFSSPHDYGVESLNCFGLT